ncbi:MAG: hypothetical protein DI533_17225 [Cereibacter sphaeroides]|uniref:Uncharacterized protein n=1 Tax=Cereibacter sphaeroides TaxID=1063 RepID=A0A2W5TKE1_CERSP|nr:MAG: hypothetical protein DI533_17225 [Cereibacter sphaeroides]
MPPLRSQHEVVLSIHAQSLVSGTVALLLVATPVLALDVWSERVERGLPTFSLDVGRGSLRLVCDPDRAFGPTANGTLIVHFEKDRDPSMIVFLTKTGEQTRLPMSGGMVAQSASDPGDWARMVEIIRSGGTFALVSSRDSLTFETAPLPSLACD